MCLGRMALLSCVRGCVCCRPKAQKQVRLSCCDFMIAQALLRTSRTCCAILRLVVIAAVPSDSPTACNCHTSISAAFPKKQIIVILQVECLQGQNGKICKDKKGKEIETKALDQLQAMQGQAGEAPSLVRPPAALHLQMFPQSSCWRISGHSGYRRDVSFKECR